MKYKDILCLEAICRKNSAELEYVNGNSIGIQIYHSHCFNSSVEVFANDFSSLVSKLRNYDYANSPHICDEAIKPCREICLAIADELEILDQISLA